jgi:Cu2+-exporting ATPase
LGDRHCRAGGVLPLRAVLATPSALAAATDRLLREGTLVVRGNVLETLQRADTIVFDKTGTLTQGRPQMTALWSCIDQAQALSVAAAMERGSLHPLAKALVEEAGRRGSAACEVAELGPSRGQACTSHRWCCASPGRAWLWPGLPGNPFLPN